MVTTLTRKRAHAPNPELNRSSKVQKPARKRSHLLSKNVARDELIPNTIIPEVAPIEQQSNAAVAPIEQPNDAPAATIGQQSNAPTTLIPQNVQQIVDQGPVNPPKKRGPNTNAKLTKTLEDLPRGTKISFKMDSNTMNFVGPSATTFATECGIIIRNVCPMEYHRWDSIPQDDKNVMYEKLQGKFELLRTDRKFMEYVNARLREHWKRYRGELSKHWKNVGGKTNPQLARQKMKPGCRSQEDWDHLCKYWEMEKTQKYSEKMEANRKKQVNVSRGGSRSIANLVHKMSTPETPTPSPLEVYHNLHYRANEKGKEWLNDHARIEYENICKHKQVSIDKLKEEGTTLITTTMEHDLERKAIKTVCGRKKSIQSGWEVGVGLVMKKKDSWMKDVETSQQVDSTSQQDPNEINELREKVSELEVYKRNYQKMAAFMRQKFPDFEGTIASPVNTEAEGSNEVLTNSDI